MKKRLFNLFASLIVVISLVSILPTMAVSAINGELKSVQIHKGIPTISKYSFHAETDVGAVIAFVIVGVILVSVVVFGIAFAIRKRKK